MINKHKYMGYRAGTSDNVLTHIIGGPLTGWLFSDNVRQSTCPKCGSEPGYHCQTPKGRKAWPPHSERGNPQ